MILAVSTMADRLATIATLGRLDALRESGQIDQLLTSLGRFSAWRWD